MAFSSKILFQLTQRNNKSQILQMKSLRSFGAFVNHRNTEDNLEETPFEFTQDNYIKIKDKLKNFPNNYKHSAVIPVLFIA